MSPYENEIRQHDFFRTGLLAAIRPGQTEPLKALLAAPPAELKRDLEQAGIRNLSVFCKTLAGREWCLAYFEFFGKEREDAAVLIEKSSPWWEKVMQHLEPHPLADQRGTRWLRMEWMNHVGGAEGKSARSVDRHCVVSRLKPEKELWYRTLHQTNWPGVADQMSRSNVRHWTTFAVGIGAELYLFSYYEYIGENMAADMEAMKLDPVTQRWWTHTEPCLDPLPELAGKGSWAEMAPLPKAR